MTSTKLLLFTLLFATLYLSTLAISQGNGKWNQPIKRSNLINPLLHHPTDNSLHSVIVNQVRGRLTTAGNSTTVNEEPPCDPTTNACMDWCGEVVRRPGRCPGTQMCCVLIYWARGVHCNRFIIIIIIKFSSSIVIISAVVVTIFLLLPARLSLSHSQFLILLSAACFVFVVATCKIKPIHCIEYCVFFYIMRGRIALLTRHSWNSWMSSPETTPTHQTNTHSFSHSQLCKSLV